MKSPECAELAACRKAEPVRGARAAQGGFIFPWAMLMNPTVLLGIALAAASAFGYLQTVRLGAAQDRIIAVQARFDQFRAQVAAEGKLAQERAENQRKQDLQRAKEADDEAKKRYLDLDRAYASYRVRVRSGAGASQRLVSRATATAPDGGQRCYSADTLDREITGALDRFRGRLAQSVEPYDRATEVARTCKDWAVGID